MIPSLSYLSLHYGAISFAHELALKQAVGHTPLYFTM